MNWILANTAGTFSSNCGALKLHYFLSDFIRGDFDRYLEEKTTKRMPFGGCLKSIYCFISFVSLFLGSVAPVVVNPPAVDSSWGNWGPWSSCSRTCGGGVRSFWLCSDMIVFHPMSMIYPFPHHYQGRICFNPVYTSCFIDREICPYISRIPESQNCLTPGWQGFRQPTVGGEGGLYFFIDGFC